MRLLPLSDSPRRPMQMFAADSISPSGSSGIPRTPPSIPALRNYRCDRGCAGEKALEQCHAEGLTLARRENDTRGWCSRTLRPSHHGSRDLLTPQPVNDSRFETEIQQFHRTLLRGGLSSDDDDLQVRDLPQDEFGDPDEDFQSLWSSIFPIQVNIGFRPEAFDSASCDVNLSQSNTFGKTSMLIVDWSMVSAMS